MRDEIHRLLAQVLDIDPNSVTDDEHWDSLQQLELMLAIEEHFGVTMTAEEMTQLTSVDSIEKYLVAEIGDSDVSRSEQSRQAIERS